MSTAENPATSHQPCDMGHFCLGPATEPGHKCLCEQARAEVRATLAAIDRSNGE